MSKCSTSAVLPRPVTKIICSIPAARASSTAYWMSGRSTIGSSSLGIALVAGRKRVPRPATGNTALRMGFLLLIARCHRKRRASRSIELSPMNLRPRRALAGKRKEGAIMGLLRMGALGALGYFGWKAYEKSRHRSPAAFANGQEPGENLTKVRDAGPEAMADRAGEDWSREDQASDE